MSGCTFVSALVLMLSFRLVCIGAAGHQLCVWYSTWVSYVLLSTILWPVWRSRLRGVLVLVLVLVHVRVDDALGHPVGGDGG